MTPVPSSQGGDKNDVVVRLWKHIVSIELSELDLIGHAGQITVHYP